MDPDPDPYLRPMDPDPNADLDHAIFISEIQDINKKKFV
jgi:hypothetical protein